MVIDANVNQRVLLIDDDPEFIEMVRDMLPEQVELRVTTDADAALRVMLGWQPNLIMVDALLTSRDAFLLLEEIRSARGNACYGIVYLAKGRGARTHFQVLGNELFGVLQRSADRVRLRHDLSHALGLTAGYTCEQVA
jgi:CheY-like chemotaxis protein